MKKLNSHKIMHLGYKYFLLFFIIIMIVPSINILAKTEISLNKSQLTDFIKGQIAAKLEAAFMASANQAEGVVRNATYFNEILRDYEKFGLDKTNFAQTAVELYREYQASLKKDAEESDPANRNNAGDFLKGKMKSVVTSTLTSMLDKESQAIVGSLKGLWSDAQTKFDKILGAKKYITENPKADSVKVLRDFGLHGYIIDDMEFLEKSYNGFKKKFSGSIEALGALRTVTNAIRSKNPGDKIEALFSLGAQFGGRIPVLGKFVELYFKVAQEMINACKGLGAILRKRERFCVGGVTTAHIAGTIGSDPQNVQWKKQFPDRRACPVKQVGIFRSVYKEETDDGTAIDIFFWVDGRYIAGRQHGGVSGLQAMISWLRRNNHHKQAIDIKFLAKAYNIPPGFVNRQKQAEKMAKRMKREINRIAKQMLCKSDVIEKFLLNKMGLKTIMDGIGIDAGLVRYFPVVKEIVDKVIEDRLIKNKASFYTKCIKVLNKLTKTMVFRVKGSVKDGKGKKLTNIRIDVSSSGKMIKECSDAVTDSNGRFSLRFTKTLSESFKVTVKATNRKNESEENSVSVSGTTEEYDCDITFGKTDVITSISITPADKKIDLGSNVTYVAIGVKADGGTEVIPKGMITWTGASSGVFTGVAAGTFTITAKYEGKSATATVTVKEKRDEEEKEDLEDALDDIKDDIEDDPCKGGIVDLIAQFQGFKASIENKFDSFTAASTKFFQEINAQRADPCTNQMVAFTYYNGKKIAAEVSSLQRELETKYSEIIVMSVACKLKSAKDSIKNLLYDFRDIGPKMGTISLTLAAMQAKLGELSCDENEVNNNGQQVTAQGTIDPNLLQQGGGMIEIQNDSVDNTGESLQDEHNYGSSLLIMVWDSGSAKDDIFSVSLSGFGTLGTTPKGSRQVFSRDRISPGTYTVSITTLVTDVGAGTWSVIVSYKGKTLVPATSGSDSGSVSFVIPE